MANTGTDYGAVLEALNEKADRDMDNLANDGKEVVANLGMPSDTYIELTLPESGGSIITPADGYVSFRKTAGIQNAFVLLSLYTSELTFLMSYRMYVSAVTNSLDATIPARKGQRVVVYYSATGNTDHFRFIYAEGTKHLAPQS